MVGDRSNPEQMQPCRSDEVALSGTSGSYHGVDMPLLSVMLPTYRRPDALARTLAGLERQSIAADSFDIVVVDDGSRDGTAEYLQQFAARTRSRFSYLVLKKNGGPARARNFGLAHTRGSAVLILGDDIEPDTDLVRSHFQFHENNPDSEDALLGHVSFPDVPEPSEFMRWLEKGGSKYFFDYQSLTPGQRAGPLYFYTCNVSVKMALLDKSGWFDESFPYASHEDLELGYRLIEQGMRMIYEPQASGLHFHTLTVGGIARRIYLMGYSAALFWRKVTERGGRAKQLLRNLITMTVSSPPAVAMWRQLAQKEFHEHKKYPLHWHVLLFLSFFIGLSDSKRGRDPRL